MTTTKKMPALRFPEFEGEWSMKLLGDVATFSKGKGVSKSDIDENGKFECIRYGELYTHYNELIKDVISKTNVDEKELVFSEYNDVIIPGSGETQLDIATASCVLREGVALGGDLNIIKTKINGVFLAYYLNNAKKSDIATLAQGNSVVHLYASQLKTLSLNLPVKEEQQKIASFLTAVDDKIQQLTKKKALLEQYKKGVMQQIFNQQIRFKDDDGNDYPDWEEKALGAFADVTKLAGYEFTKHIVYKDSGKIIALRALNIKSNALDLTEVKYVDESDFSKLKRSKLFINDLMFTYIGTIGEVALIEENDRFYLAPNVARIRLHSSDNEPAFLKHYFSFDNFKNNEVKNYIATSSQPALSMENIRKFKILLPSSIEQKKIADFLTSIDNKINSVNKQLEQTQEYKKGLLQQMFV